MPLSLAARSDLVGQRALQGHRSLHRRVSVQRLGDQRLYPCRGPGSYLQFREESRLPTCLLRAATLVRQESAQPKPEKHTACVPCSPRQHRHLFCERPRDRAPSQPGVHPSQRHLATGKRPRDPDLAPGPWRFQNQPAGQLCSASRPRAALTSGQRRLLQAQAGDGEKRSAGGEARDAGPRGQAASGPAREEQPEEQSAQREPRGTRARLPRNTGGDGLRTGKGATHRNPRSFIQTPVHT